MDTLATLTRLAEAERLLLEALRRYPPYKDDPYPSEVRAFLRSATICLCCNGTGAVGAPTSDDDPSCADCDGEGRIYE